MSMTVAVPQPGTLTTSQVLSGLETVRGVLAPDLSDDELRLFAMVANRSGLDPFAKQIYAVKRKSRVTFQTGIDGYRSSAERTGEYLGSDEPEYGPWVEKPFGHPEWARVVVKRAGRDPQAATAFWDEFVPSDGQDQMWRKMPRNQLAKCAEALAFRKAFPFLLADVYTTEEMQQAEPEPAEDARSAEVASIPDPRGRIAARRQRVEAPEAVRDAPGAEPEPEAEPEPAEDVVEGSARAACDATSDPQLGDVEVCALPAGHESGPGPKRHQAASGTVWPVAKGGRS